MANQEHLDILKQGRDVWNEWRKEHPEIQPDLSDCNLTEFSNANLSNTNLSNTNLSRTMLAFTDLSRANLQRANVLETILLRANFDGANLDRACFSFSNLSGANFTNTIHINRVIINGANLSKADLSNCSLSGANFSECNLSRANLSRADLTGADLSRAILIETNMRKATLTGCSIFGISAWGVELEGATQGSLVITSANEPMITVDNLEVAQLIYLFLNNENIRHIIDTITYKVVLILGRFTLERKKVLDALRESLRNHDYIPVVFDFEKPTNRDITETVSILAHMARFVIADITEAKSIPQELSHIVPFLPSVPIVPLLEVSDREYGMYEHFISFLWVQPIYHYRDLDELLHSLQEHIIDPAEKRVRELAIEKAKRLERP